MHVLFKHLTGKEQSHSLLKSCLAWKRPTLKGQNQVPEEAEVSPLQEQALSY